MQIKKFGSGDINLPSSYNQSRPQQMSEGQRYQTTGPARLSG